MSEKNYKTCNSNTWLPHTAISLIITYAILAFLEYLVPHSVLLFLDPIWLVFTAGILALIFLALTSKK